MTGAAAPRDDGALRANGKMKEDPLKEKSLAFAVEIVKVQNGSDSCAELRRMLSATCKTLEATEDRP